MDHLLVHSCTVKRRYARQSLSFTAGSAEPAHDAVITGQASGASGTLDRVVLSSGSWAGGDAAGTLLLGVDGTTVTGTFQADEGLTVSGVSVATAGGPQADYETEIKSADGTALFTRIPKNPGYLTDGTAKSVTYTTTSHSIAGKIWLHLLNKGLKVVATAEESVTTTTTAAAIKVRSEL